VYPSEIAVHLPRLADHAKPLVLVFPKLVVCMDCGFAEFIIPEEDLQKLKDPGSNEEK
jgi:hypothetical protein